MIPVWVCGKCKEKKIFGSVTELEEASGKKVDDLHKHIVDEITVPCSAEHGGCGGIMRRIPDVLDTWFDSGSMPYAERHYPFSNKEKFDKEFPAQFIAEGLDQTRAWFYYLHVLAGALFGKNAFRNVIVNGIVLAEDGKKMAKKLKNYPDPMEVVEKYGADALRFYLLSSPVVQAENLNFSEKGVDEAAKKMVSGQKLSKPEIDFLSQESFPNEVEFSSFELMAEVFLRIGLGQELIDEIIEHLKTDWSPTALKEQYSTDDFLSPRGTEGLGDAMKDDIKRRLDVYLDKINNFFDRDHIAPHYIYSLLRGVEEMLRNKETLTLEQAGKFICFLE